MCVFEGSVTHYQNNAGFKVDMILMFYIMVGSTCPLVYQVRLAVMLYVVAYSCKP